MKNPEGQSVFTYLIDEKPQIQKSNEVQTELQRYFLFCNRKKTTNVLPFGTLMIWIFTETPHALFRKLLIIIKNPIQFQDFLLKHTP